MTDVLFTDQANKTWPFMLVLAEAAQIFRDTIITLWRRLLNTRWARRATLDALHGWIVQADTKQYMYPHVEQLVADLWSCGTARERERLLYYLGLWTQEPSKQKTFPSAARILAAVIQIP
jgi:hypothetical protein